jgi:hypothetical protein
VWQNHFVPAEPRARNRGDLVSAIQDARRIALRAGSRPHRFIPLWVVVVERRIFVRSWSLKPRSWWRTLLVEPQGVVQIGDSEVRFRAARTRSSRLKAAVDRAYLAKYGRGGEIRFARDMALTKSRATTTELVLI